jgi:hypothetical protein
MIDEESEAPRAGYKRGARSFQHIVCQL